MSNTTASLQLILVEIFFFTARWWGTSLTLVELGNDGLNNIFELLLLSLEGVRIGLRVGLEPRDLLIDGLFDLLLVRIAQLGAELVLVADLKEKNIDTLSQATQNHRKIHKINHNRPRRKLRKGISQKFGNSTIVKVTKQ